MSAPRYQYDNRPSTAGLANWGRYFERMFDSQEIVAENTTARQAGGLKWIWPVTIGVVALVLGLVLLRKRK